MRLFALRDSEDSQHTILAVLACYNTAGEYYIDMPQNTDPWTVPFVLSSFAARSVWTIGPNWAGRWVASRLVPQSRQNLGEVLRVNGLDRYDALRLLELTGGRNSQDDCHLETLAPEQAPDWFLEREERRVMDAVPLEGFRLLVAFRTGGAVVCDARKLAKTEPKLAAVVENQELFESVTVCAGGRGVRWGTHIRVDDETLRSAGKATGLSWADLSRTAPALLADTAEAASALECSRQNVNALAKRGALPAAKTTGKATLFLRADVRTHAE